MPAAENHHAARKPPRRRRLAWAGPPLALLGLTVGFYWKLVLTDQYTWLESPDLANQVLPWLQFQAGEWHKGIFPLWDPYLWSGQSLIGQAQPGAAYPLNWILFLLPLRDGWIRLRYLHWYFVLIHFMAVLFAYWLARDRKLSRGASALAGMAFGLGGYVGTTDWPQMLNGAVWAPLVFLFLLRALEGRRPTSSAALSGMFLGMAWLSGHHQIPIYTTMAASGVWLFHFLRQWRADWRVARLAAVFVVFTALTGALQILPAYEYGKLARRWVGVAEPVAWNQKVPYLVHSEYALYPLSILGIVIPGVHRHADPFAGVVVTALALLGLAAGFHQRHVRVLAAVAIGGLLFSLGHNNVFHGMLYAVAPLLEKARTPSAAIFIFHFGLSVLAAYGIDALFSKADTPWPRRVWLTLLALASTLLAFCLGSLVAGRQPEDRWASAALAALLAAGVIYGARRGHLSPRASWICLAGLALVELGNVSGHWLPHRLETNRTIYLKKMRDHADIAEFLRQQPWPLRAAVSSSDIPYNFGDWFGIDIFGGYVASLPDNLLRLGMHSERVRNLMGVGYTIAPKPEREGQREVFRGQSGLNVYLNPDALPRIWTVHEWTSVAGDDEARALLENPEFDLRRRGWMRGPVPAMESCSPDTESARLLRRESNRIEIEVRMACKGMVVLSENFFPGWLAWVDGRAAPVYEVYTALRGVVVEKGIHRIEMRYRPRTVRVGAAGTLAGIAGACLLAFYEGRRRRSPKRDENELRDNG